MRDLEKSPEFRRSAMRIWARNRLKPARLGLFGVKPDGKLSMVQPKPADAKEEAKS